MVEVFPKTQDDIPNILLGPNPKYSLFLVIEKKKKENIDILEGGIHAFR